MKKFFAGLIILLCSISCFVMYQNISQKKAIVPSHDSVQDKKRDGEKISDSISFSNNKVRYKGYEAIDCGRSNATGKLTPAYFQSVKYINEKLQEVWDKGQQLVPQYVDDAYQKLSNTSLSNTDKCMYSWLIDALQRQQGYIDEYDTEQGITTIGIDFVAYQDDSSKIDYGPTLGALFQTKNTSSKIRTYLLAKNPKLQTLYTDSNGYVTKDMRKEYINNLAGWLYEFCDNRPLFNGEKIIDRQGNDGGFINRNEGDGYCVKDKISDNIVYFQFDNEGNIQKINLDRRNLSLAN